jgi:hypothetical protein
MVNEESRLELHSIQQRYRQQGFVAIAEGGQEGEQIVTSDLIPAVSGMLLKPIEDRRTLGRLKQAASGGSGNSMKGAGKGQGAKGSAGPWTRTTRQAYSLP